MKNVIITSLVSLIIVIFGVSTLLALGLNFASNINKNFQQDKLRILRFIFSTILRTVQIKIVE